MPAAERKKILIELNAKMKQAAKDLHFEEAIRLRDEIEKIKTDGPSDDELKKVKNFSVDYLIRAMSTNAGLARNLGYYEAVAGDWKFVFQLIEDIQSVSKDDVTRVANEYLKKSNRTVGTLVTKK